MYSYLKKSINYIIYLYPHILLPFFLFNKIKRELKYIKTIRKLNYKLCELKEIQQLFKNKKSNNFAIVAPGSSFAELTMDDIKILNNTYNIVHGLWDDLPFRADILFAEFTPDKIDLLYRFVKSLNKNIKSFKNTIFLVDISNDKNFKIHKLLLETLDPILKKQVRFISSIKSMHSSFFPSAILRTKYLLNFLFERNIFWHCRSSSFYGATISLFLRPKSIFLIGIDGYSGYYVNEKYIGKDACNLNNLDSKNVKYELHSTANKEYGEPTITDAFIALSKYLTLFTVSKNQLLSKYLKCRRLSE
tara:strand:+ start:2829 stop:3740 length:912 start_codon:yes stop_codon:yes gene_type:complete